MAEPAGAEDREHEAVPSAGLPGLNGLVTLLTAVVVIAALYLAREVLIPITLAILLSFLLSPVVNALRALHLGRVPSVLLAVAFGIVLIVGIAGLIGTQIADLAQHVSLYYDTILHKIEAARDFTLGRITHLLNGLAANAPAQPKATGPAHPSGPQPVPVEIEQQPTALSLAQSVLTPVVSPLATAFVVFVVSIFVLLQREDLRDRFIRLFGSGDLQRTTVAMDDAAHRLSRYFLTQLCINAGFGCVIGICLTLIGVPSPLLWGLMAMLLRFVPYIGVPIAAILPVAVAAAVQTGWSMALWTALTYLVVEAITGQVIEPFLYGHSTGLSPAAVVIAAIFWTWIWGPIGLILSTPLTLCLVVLGRHVQRLEFLDVLLGDNPALTQVESFYQRLLAGDPDEPQEQAEEYIREHGLVRYYDEVALPGLQLAAADLSRGALRPERARRLRRAVESLVQELAEHAELPAKERTARRGHVAHAAPPGPQPDPEAMVLCIAGRGPLDDAAALILAQLLQQHGLAAQVAGHDAASRTGIAALPVRGVAMICVTYLDIAGSPVHLRNLVRRLRQRLPNQPILIGLFRREDAVLTDQRLRTVAGADLYVSCFQDAVVACVETVRPTVPARQSA